jgi:hypothetical protein
VKVSSYAVGNARPKRVEQPVALDLAVLRAQRVTEAVGPRAAHRDEPLLEAVLLGCGEVAHPLAQRHTNHELESGERGL